MPFNLTGSGAGYNSTGKFGASLNAGTATVASNVITSSMTAIAVSVWLKGGDGSSTKVAVAQTGVFWIGYSGGNCHVTYGQNSQVDLSTTVNIADGAWHHVELNAGPSGCKVYVDGVQAATSATSFASSSPQFGTPEFNVRHLSGGAFAYDGEVDDLAVYSATLHSAGFTPPTSATSTSAANLLALWNFDSNLNDSAGAAAGPTLTSPTVSSIGTTTATSGITTDTANGTLYLVESAVNTAPSAAQVKAGQVATGAAAPFAGNQAITTTGAKTINATGLSASTTYYPFWVHAGTGGDSSVTAGTSFTTNAAAATAVTLSGPSSGVVGAASSNFTAGANGTITGTVTVTPSDSGGGGTFSPTSVNISSGTPTATFTYTPSTTGAKTISVTNNGGLTNPSSITYTVSASATKAPNDAGIVYSPYNWVVGSTTAKTVNSGAYFKTRFTGNSCTLNFDMTNAPGDQNKTRLMIRVDGMTYQMVLIAASISVTMPPYGDNTKHLLEVFVDDTSPMVENWTSPQPVAVILTGITLASSSESLAAPTKYAKKAMFYGDSITAGISALGGGGGLDSLKHSFMASWAVRMANALGAEFSAAAFGSQGWLHSGAGGVPDFPSSWNSLWNGQARSFASPPDYCFIAHGTNDNADNIVSAGTTLLNSMLTAMPGTQFILVQPFAGNQGANLQAIRNACNEPGRVRYMDTTGMFSTTEAIDGLHPYSYEFQAHIAPLMVASMQAGATLTARTVGGTLTSGGSAAAGLSGLKWAYSDSFGGPVLSSGNNFSTNGSGVYSLSVQSALSVGQTGYLQITNSDGTTSQSPVAKIAGGPVVLA